MLIFKTREDKTIRIFLLKGTSLYSAELNAMEMTMNKIQ